ncbi:hypothetical protein BH24ACT21_BH24ACT21_16450 [soil metagenome]|jgi:uncharacterized SAM-dependent methyltransferase
MRTGIGTKFTLGSAARMFDEIGLRLLELYTDDKDLCGLALAAPQR